MAEITLTTSGTALTLTASGASLTFETAGELNAAANVGAGANVFRDKVGAVLNFRTLLGVGLVSVVVNGDVVEISTTAENNIGANVGAGSNVFRDKVASTLNFRTLVAADSITVNVVGDTVEIGGGGTTPTGTATFIAFFDALGVLADSVLFVDDATTPTQLTVPLDLDSGSGRGHVYASQEPDSASAVGHLFQTTVLDKDTFTAGALHSKWEDADGDEILSLSPDGVLTIGGGPSLFENVANSLAIDANGGTAFQFFFTNGGQFGLQSGAVTRGSIAQTADGIVISSNGSTRGLELQTLTADSPTIPGFQFRTRSTLFGSGNLHSQWINGEFGSGRIIMELERDGILVLLADDAADNAVVDSPDFILRANHDADAGGGVTPTGFDALLRHNMLTAGAAPTSQLDFLVNSAVRLSLPSAAPPAYTRNAVVVTDRTLLASASATTINNNNVLAALIEDLQARNLIG